MYFIVIFTVIQVFIPSSQQQRAHYNVSFGNDPAQLIDIYEPANKPSKAVLLIHGGAWYSGRKEDLSQFVGYLKQDHSQYLICNMDYRLASVFDRGYPKQLEDVEAALKFVRSKYGKDLKFALLGGSAGAHLAMLYSYKTNTDNAVQAIINVVGPADFTETGYAYNIFLNLIIMNFVGPYFYVSNPQIYNETSPTTWITSAAPKTISFYGDKDPLVPFQQGPRLKAKLDKNNVVNEFYRYPGGHADWAPQYMDDLKKKTSAFLNKYF